jgi:hypothetical protein
MLNTEAVLTTGASFVLTTVDRAVPLTAPTGLRRLSVCERERERERERVREREVG